MADVTEVICWPSCIDAINWSEDGIVALASDDCVELLFPNTVSFNMHQDAAHWQHVQLKAPLFSYDELPIKEPASLLFFSVGEEISQSAPIAIAWSHSGLAKHRKCALGVLTANLVLAIWSADKTQREESNWNRTLIINDAILAYFSSLATPKGRLPTAEIEEQVRVQSRVRAFTWAPALPTAATNIMMGTQLSFSPHLLALSNDANDIVFVAIESPYSRHDRQDRWNAHILSHTSIEKTGKDLPVDCVFEDVMYQQRFVSHLAWSPWTKQDDVYRSIIVYATNKDFRARTITYASKKLIVGDEVVYIQTDMRSSGPMKWAPAVNLDGRLSLVLCTNSGLTCLEISMHDAEILGKIHHPLDDRWDEVSGIAWDLTHTSPRLHVSTLLSTQHCQTAILELHDRELRTLESPSWRDQLENNLVLFSVKNELKGHSKSHVWGLTMAPFGGFMMAAYSVHPSDMIEYGPPGDRRTTVAISALQQYNASGHKFPHSNTSSEGILFILKKLAENTVEDIDQMPDFAQEMEKVLVQSLPSSTREECNSIILTTCTGDIAFGTLIEAVKRAAYLNENMLRDRCSILVSQVTNITASNELCKTLIAYRFAQVIKSIPASLCQTPFSADLMRQYYCLVALIDKVLQVDTEENEPSGRLAESAGLHAANDQGSTDTQSGDAWAESCDICSALIPFTDLTVGKCRGGHQFPRCGLSFMTIQAPAITKYCGLCSTPFLHDSFVTAQEVGVGTSDSSAVMDVEGADAERIQITEMEVTLARVVFSACDVCIYCGGRFEG